MIIDGLALLSQCRDFALGQMTPAADRQASQAHGADGDTLKADHLMTNGQKHPANLPIASLGQCEFDFCPAFLGNGGLGGHSLTRLTP